MSLRNDLIKLAHENPELRADLLPLLKTAADQVIGWDSKYVTVNAKFSKGAGFSMDVEYRSKGFSTSQEQGAVYFDSETIREFEKTIAWIKGRVDRFTNDLAVEAKSHDASVQIWPDSDVQLDLRKNQLAYGTSVTFKIQDWKKFATLGPAIQRVCKRFGFQATSDMDDVIKTLTSVGGTK